MKEPTEKDFLHYTGSHIPRVIRLVWTILILFSVYYIAKYAWPNLLEALK